MLIQEPKAALPADFDPRTRDWYKESMDKKGEVVISNPYKSADTGDMVVTISQTTKDGSGVVAVDLSLKYLEELISQVKIGKEGYATLLDENRNYIYHPKKDAGTEAVGDFHDQIYAKKSGEFDFVFDGQKKVLAFTTNELTGWKIAGSVRSKEITDTAALILNKTIVVILISILLGAAVVFFIIRSIIKPIEELKEKAITISKGDLTASINIRSNDEIGQLSQAFYQMQESLRGLVQEVEHNAQQVAASAEELTASAEQTSAATSQVAMAIQEVASSAEKQTNGLNRNAQNLAVVSEGVSHIAESSVKVSELAHHTTMQAEEGGRAVTNTVSQMNSIHDSVNRIKYDH